MKAFPQLIAALAMAATASIASAQNAHGHDAHAGHGGHGGHAGHGTATALELTAAEVKKIDKETGKITLRHGELKNLNMGAMTMAFRVKDAAMLDGVKVGDQVKFAADRVNGAITVVQLQAAQ